jgi:hypothetical protein
MRSTLCRPRTANHDELLDNYIASYANLLSTMEGCEVGGYTTLLLPNLEKMGILEPMLDWVLAEHQERIDRRRLSQAVRIVRGIYENDQGSCLVVYIDGEKVLVWPWQAFFHSDAFAESWVVGMSGVFNTVSPEGQRAGWPTIEGLSVSRLLRGGVL